MFLAVVSVYTAAQTWWAEKVRGRFEDETGAVATEYVLLLALIALFITAGMVILATAINDKFQASADCLNNGGPC
jgi:Flp pilus assembly pilin Flp